MDKRLLSKAGRNPLAPPLIDRVIVAWTAVVLAFLYLPIGVLVVYSFNSSKLNVVREGFTLSTG